MMDLFLLWLAKGFQYINSANYIDSPEEKEENKSEEISLEEKSSMWKKDKTLPQLQSFTPIQTCCL